MRVYALAILLVFLTGCIQQQLFHDVARDGSSTLTIAYEFEQFLNLSQRFGAEYGMPDGIPYEIFTVRVQTWCAAAEKEKPEMECDVNGTRLVLSVPLEAGNPYYDLETEETVVFRTYRFTMHTLPLNEFSTSQPLDVRLKPPQSVDLTEKEQNAATAASMQSLNGMVFTYTVQMPGSIVQASAGNYSASIEGNRATFELLEVLGDSAPITVESREVNMLLLLALAAIAVLVLATFSFLRGRSFDKKR